MKWGLNHINKKNKDYLVNGAKIKGSNYNLSRGLITKLWNYKDQIKMAIWIGETETFHEQLFIVFSCNGFSNKMLETFHLKSIEIYRYQYKTVSGLIKAEEKSIIRGEKRETQGRKKGRKKKNKGERAGLERKWGSSMRGRQKRAEGKNVSRGNRWDQNQHCHHLHHFRKPETKKKKSARMKTVAEGKKKKVARSEHWSPSTSSSSSGSSSRGHLRGPERERKNKNREQEEDRSRREKKAEGKRRERKKNSWPISATVRNRIITASCHYPPRRQQHHEK